MVNQNEIQHRDGQRETNLSFPNSANFLTRQTKNNFSSDELIASLANAVENKRARQANEWESLGMKTIQPTIAAYRQ